MSDATSPKPCSFCGCSNYRLVPETGWMDCLSCGAGSPRWNSRPIEEALEARVAELVGELDESLERYDRSTSELVQQVDTFAQCRSLEAQENIKLRLERESLRSRVADLEQHRERLDWLERRGCQPIEFSQPSRTSEGNRCGEAGRIAKPFRSAIDKLLAVEWNENDELRALTEKRDALANKLGARTAAALEEK